MKQLLAKFDNNWQADAVKNLLSERQIAYYEIKSSREYVSILTGIGQGFTELYVDADQLSDAKSIYEGYRKATSLHLVSTDQISEQKDARPQEYYRKVVFLSLASLILFPILFNLIATWNFKLLWNNKIEQHRRVSAVLVLVACWLLAGVEAWWIVGKSWSQ